MSLKHFRYGKFIHSFKLEDDSNLLEAAQYLRADHDPVFTFLDQDILYTCDSISRVASCTHDQPVFVHDYGEDGLNCELLFNKLCM